MYVRAFCVPVCLTVFLLIVQVKIKRRMSAKADAARRRRTVDDHSGSFRFLFLLLVSCVMVALSRCLCCLSHMIQMRHVRARAVSNTARCGSGSAARSDETPLSTSHGSQRRSAGRCRTCCCRYRTCPQASVVPWSCCMSGCTWLVMLQIAAVTWRRWAVTI